MVECVPWVDEIVYVRFREPSSKPRIFYESPPLFIPRGSRVKIEASAIDGDYTCGMFDCFFEGKIIIRLVRKATGEAHEYSFPVIITNSLGYVKVRGSKSMELIPLNQGKYHIEAVLPPFKKAFNAWLKLGIKAFICR